MKLQNASKREIKRITAGTVICGLILLTTLFILNLEGIGRFDHTVFLGVLGGSIVAILNFTVMCLTIQKAIDIEETRQRKIFLQGSYNGRLLLQTGWILAAFLIPHLHVIAAAMPLLFPNLTIFYLQSKGKLVESCHRKAPADGPEDHTAGFEI